MEWLDKIKDFPNLIQQEPRYGYLVVAGLLLIACRCHLWLEVDVFPSG